MIDKIVFASKNKGKIREVNQLFSNLGIEILQVSDDFDVVENGKTFLDNAVIKAKAATRLCNCIALADDSGLVVDALNGAPGVHSSRYADGDQNRIVKLLNALKNVEKGYRQARFICSMALVKPGGELIYSAMGVCEGEIAFEPQGDDGFGYDPIFYVTELGMTMAQIPLSKKNTISHRAKAFKQMFNWVEKNI